MFPVISVVLTQMQTAAAQRKELTWQFDQSTGLDNSPLSSHTLGLYGALPRGCARPYCMNASKAAVDDDKAEV